jgi:tRNA (cytidine/uridine-2'-O-)-methyltransferase
MGLSIILIQPEIPGNTGAIGRTCVALGMELILIHPLGFDISDKQVKRAGLDYWPHVNLTEYANWEAFLAARTPRPDQLFLFEEFGSRSFYEPDYPDRLFHLPMRSDVIRSLNLANTVAAAAYQALRGNR